MISRPRGIQLKSKSPEVKRIKKRVEPADLIGSPLRSHELGLEYAHVIGKLRESFSLFYKEKSTLPHTPHFIISTESVPPDFAQRWISEAIPHLAISDFEERYIEVGPLVIPGATPCLHCVALERAAENPIYRDIELMKSLEPAPAIPASLVSLIAGTVVLEVSEFAALGRSSLLATSARYDARNPSATTRRYWSRSHECGCTGIAKFRQLI